MNISLTDLGLVSSLGTSLAQISKNAKLGTLCGFTHLNHDVPNENIPFFSVNLEEKPNILRCNALINLAFNQIKDSVENLKSKYKLERLGIVLGSSNTGIHEAKEDITTFLTNNNKEQFLNDFSFEKIMLGTPALYLKNLSGFKGVAYVISTACSSSAKAFQSARNLIRENICDAVLVGGVDSRCSFANLGFFSLSALSLKRTNPFSKNRDGINLGEGAALFIMEKEENTETKNCIKLLGIGESTDNIDLTSPDPSGAGAYTSMSLALKDAKLETKDINYINMHATGTIHNDSMEGLAVYNLFKNDTLCASTKPLTGHALGASGAIEAALSYLMLKEQFLIPHIYDGEYDESIPKINLATKENISSLSNIYIKNILSNSFAFGGSNCSIILGR